MKVGLTYPCAFILVLLLIAPACDSQPTDPVIESVEPNTAPQGESIEVTIKGEFYLDARVSEKKKSRSRLGTEFSGRLGDVALQKVEYVDFTHLTATVPPTLETGTHDLTIVDPAGREGTLRGAFSMTAPDTATDTPEDTVQDTATDTTEDTGQDTASDTTEDTDQDSTSDTIEDTAPDTATEDTGCANCYLDADGDMYGNPLLSIEACQCPNGYVRDNTDCADTPTSDADCNGLDGALCNPGLEGNDSCDGADNDCDGSVDEDFVSSPSTCGQGVCASTGTLTCVNGMILDDCLLRVPDETEDVTCDGLDGDCDGEVDEDYTEDASCGVGYCFDNNTPSSCSGGIETVCQPGQPQTEGPEGDPTCADLVDNDCDGLTDSFDSGCDSAVGNLPPAAAFTVTPSGGDTATVFDVDASSSSDAENAAADLRVRWDWESDGTWDNGFDTVKTADHTFAVEGTYTITLEVIDTGGASDFASTTVAVGVPDDVYVVTTPEDEDEEPGTGLSLREALDLVNIGEDNLDTITFAGPMTIMLQSQLPSIKEDTFIAADGSVVIDGSNLNVGRDCFSFDASSTSSLIGLEIRNCPRDGILIDGVMPIVTVRDCYIHDNGRHGITVFQLPGQIIGPGNEISSNGASGVAIDRGFATDTVVQGNRIHDNGENGIVLLVAGEAEPDRTTILLNEIWGNTNAGIDVDNSDDHIIWHNTIVGNGLSGVLFGADSSGTDLRNNIVAGSIAGYGIDANGASIADLDYNLFYDNSLGPCNGCDPQPNAVFLDPLFEDAAADNFELTAMSPAVDVGADVPLDVNGPAPDNYNGTAPDIGAREAR